MSIRAEGKPEDIFDLVGPGDDLILAMANGEATLAVDALERDFQRLRGVRIHQMHAMRARPHIDGLCGDHLRHVSYFLTAPTRAAFRAGTCDLVPADFAAVPTMLREHTRCSLVLAAASPPNDDGWVTLGTNAEYVASLIGEVPFFLEVNAQMPRTGGEGHRLHLSQVAGWYAADRPLIEVQAPAAKPADHAIAQLIAERIPNGAALQFGIGRIPNAVASALHDHRALGVHSELISDWVMDLVERGVVTGERKHHLPGRAVGTFAMGSERFHRWLDREARVELHRVDWVNDPRVIAQEPGLVSINATTEVDLYGQCASETMAGRYWSSSGGQADFARGSMWSPGGEAFIALHSVTSDGHSRISPTLPAGSVVTTSKNIVDHVVTEWGIASLRGRTLDQRARALVAIAHPDHRPWLERAGRKIGLIH